MLFGPVTVDNTPVINEVRIPNHLVNMSKMRPVFLTIFIDAKASEVQGEILHDGELQSIQIRQLPNRALHSTGGR